MLIALLPGILLMMWGLGTLFDGSEPDEDDDTLPVADFPGTFELTDGSDTFIGTGGADTIYAGQGDDVILAAPEYIDAEPEGYPIDHDDIVYLGAGDDTFGQSAAANEGNDLVRGGAGNDVLLVSGFGDSTVYGDLGDDIIKVHDLAHRGFAGDTVYGGDGNDMIHSDTDDVVSGGAGQDSFFINHHYCTQGVSTIITDYEPGESIELFVTYHPNPGLQTITSVPSADGGSQILSTWGYNIVLQGITEPVEVEMLIQSEYDVDPDFYCD